MKKLVKISKYQFATPVLPGILNDLNEGNNCCSVCTDYTHDADNHICDFTTEKRSDKGILISTVSGSVCKD